MNRRSIRPIAVLAILALGIVPAVFTSTAGASAGTKAKGKAYKVVVILAESQTQGITLKNIRAGIKAGLAKINAGDGLGDSGRPVKAEFCVNDLDPNKAAQCARDAVADPDVIALVNQATGDSSVVNPILEAAGMASVAPLGVTISDFTSPIAFNVHGGFAGPLCQIPLLADEAGAKTIGVFNTDLPGGDAVIPIVRTLATASKATIGGIAAVSTTKADVSADVVAVTDGADATVAFVSGEVDSRIIRTERQLSPDVDIAVTGLGNVTSPNSLAKLGKDGEGMYVAASFATDDMPGAGIKEYLKWLKKTGGTKDAEDFTKNAYLGLNLLDVATVGLPTIDRASVLAALGKVSAFDTGGLTPVIDFTKVGVPFPRVPNPTCVYAQVKNGKVKALDQTFHTPLTPLTAG